ncbi:hypothetical protein ACQ4PT_050212 [Festuca glaucescens]
MGEASPESSGAAAGGPSIPAPPRKGKSCKGCLYYSSVLKSRGYNPICLGIPRSIPQVPGFVVEEPREEVAAQGHDLRQFKYACAGYSMFVDDRDGKSAGDEAKALLPYCQGLELLRPTLRARSKDRNRSSQDRNSWRGKYKRSAGLVASGVVKNMGKAGAYIKQNIEDIVSMDRRPPK